MVSSDSVVNAHAFWSFSESNLFSFFKTSKKGLSSGDAKERLKENGFNELKASKGSVLLEIAFRQFRNPLVFVLIIASIIAFFLGDAIESQVIILIVIVNALFGFFQEYRAQKALEELQKFITIRTKVLRDGKKIEINSRELVKGDIVYLTIGDIIPADIRLLEAEEFSTNESSLTGESNAVEKKIEVIDEKYSLPQQLTNMAFMGTSAASGLALGVVVAVGEETVFGKTAEKIKQAPTEDSFQKNISKFSSLLLKIIIIMTVFIFLANALLGKGIFDSFLFALALAVGITPEALPIIITITLSHNALKMAKNKVVVKKLDSLEDLGNMDTLCCDKTGTLTEGKIHLEHYQNVDGEKDEQLILYGMLCNSANKAKHTVFGNPIDSAILESKEAVLLEKKVSSFVTLHHNEFDFERKRMSVITKTTGLALMIAKGAPESIFSVCSKVHQNGISQTLTNDILSKLKKKVIGFESEGYTVIAVASKSIDLHKNPDPKKHDEFDLCLTGFLLFLDPPKESAKEALATMKKLGVTVKLITGDSPIIAQKICKEVGLIINEDRVVTGDDLSKLGEKEFEEYAAKYSVFARVTPEQKYKIVLSLNKEGHVVGFLGDGINDAPALKAADVGISVDTAAGIAKESANIILLNKSLHTLALGNVDGRKAFGNITKYVLMATSSNYGNMFTLALSSLYLKFIPLLPSQILLENLLSDAPSVSIATDSVDEYMLKRPRKWNNKFIFEFMIYFGLLSVVFDVIMIGVLLFIFNSTDAMFRSAWFFESLISEVLVSFAIRTRIPVLKSTPSFWFIASSAFACLLGALFVFSTIGATWFKFQPIPLDIMIIIAIISVAGLIAAELVKTYFFKKYEM